MKVVILDTVNLILMFNLHFKNLIKYIGNWSLKQKIIIVSVESQRVKEQVIGIRRMIERSKMKRLAVGELMVQTIINLCIDS